MNKFAQLDHKYVWHPFTQMRDWLRSEPLVIASGDGAMLRDVRGNTFLDANSSIWTNLHGHNHPKINSAISTQLKKIAHSSALGLANKPASLLAEKLIKAANFSRKSRPRTANPKLEKVFFSDNGSTALEVALKLAYQFSRRVKKIKNPKFLSVEGAYHGDTVGAVSLGHIDLFHKSYAGLLFKSGKVMSPYCYRCPFNRAKPERADARDYRKCNWECIGNVQQKFSAERKKGNPCAAFVFEPLIQGAAGMIAQPRGWLSQVSDIAREHGALLIADEVMTAFGRTGFPDLLTDDESNSFRQPLQNPAKDFPPNPIPSFQRGPAEGNSPSPGLSRHSEAKAEGEGRDEGERKKPSSNFRPFMENLLACRHENVQPDFACLAKGITGGYLPMAATLTTRKVFDAFLGRYDEFKSFFHGHSYTANQLGAAAALASLELLQSNKSVIARQNLQKNLQVELQSLWPLQNVGDIRQVGLVAGIELVKDWRTRKPFDLRDRAGIRVCEAMAARGVLTRPVGNVIVLMPPYCTTAAQLKKIVRATRESIAETLRSSIEA